MPVVIAVVGPTGTGKSDLALDLAERLGGEVVNADSMQFYRGMNIGTAKLPPEQRRGVPHHLLDTLELREEASLAEFQTQAREAIAQIQQRGLHPLVVGGSGLYVRAALDVLELPPTDPALRDRLAAELEDQGVEAFRVRLRAVDPASEARIGDARRLVRAMEVYELTGRTFESFMPRREYVQPAVQIGLNGDRGVLHNRLATRVRQMSDGGLLEEVRRLDLLGLREGKTASRALGYQQFLRVLGGQTGQDGVGYSGVGYSGVGYSGVGYSEEQAIEDTVVATRQFARRQVTWFSADPRVHWLDFAGSPEKKVTAVIDRLRGSR
ncbi:tRNA (adenosine(37)-N6)-dimethylallyltransferase MiaA [Psychromicrobium xiongbiense]|uniref:tRNA (adenosine(37)-N6)-dimethylallyltransferase MiaA n=1 Tax=Psychromicrobium xiongbiense TaxID=3051184 RepID=UPI002552FEC7|nr:tRNA (adenosine(37)-N6)-dimethylallyltransferase MiaA [Psychromicrobium sp. YIM S02556]